MLVVRVIDNNNWRSGSRNARGHCACSYNRHHTPTTPLVLLPNTHETDNQHCRNGIGGRALAARPIIAPATLA